MNPEKLVDHLRREVKPHGLIQLVRPSRLKVIVHRARQLDRLEFFARGVDGVERVRQHPRVDLLNALCDRNDEVEAGPEHPGLDAAKGEDHTHVARLDGGRGQAKRG